MSRTVDAAITAGEISPAPAFRHKAVVYNPLLAFAAPSSNADGSLDQASPQTYRLRSSGTVAYAAYRHTSGTHYLRAVDLTTAANAALSSTNAVTIATSGTMVAMRSGFSIESGTHYIYSSTPSGSAIQVRRASLSGTTNPLTASFSNYGPTFGSAMTNTADVLIRRVEAVCPCDNGQVVVAIGEHDFANDLSTITFWLLPDNSTAVQLNTILHLPLDEAYSSWYGNAKHCSFISAVYESATDRIIVVANAAVNGRAVYFTIQNGIESTVRNVIPIDASTTTVSFMPSGLTAINGWLYLSGHMTRRRTNGDSLTSFECYLIGDASGNFSLGEKSHVVTTSTCNGTMLLPASGSTVYYVGNGYHTTATATPLQNASLTGTEYTDRLLGWTLDQGTNGADGFTATLDNADGTLTSASLLAGGKVLQLQSGQDATYANVGEYGLDKPRVAVSVKGRGPLAISGRSLGDKTLLGWKSPLTLQLMSRSRVKTDLANGLTGLIQKTNDMNAERLKFTSLGMSYRGLNEPWIALTDEYDHGDHLTHLVVQADVDDAYHLSTIGVLIGASDDGEGNVFVLPKDGTWGDDVLTGPQMRVLNLNSIDPLDPEKADTGWNMTARTNGLVKSSTVGGVRTTAANVGYPTSTSWAMTPATKYGVYVRTVGRRAQMFTRTWNLAPASCATNAGYTLRAEALFAYNARKTWSDTPRSGVAIGTDVWGDTGALAEAGYEDFQQTLTYATNSATIADFTNLAYNITSGNTAGAHTDIHCTVAFTNPTLTVGQVIYVVLPTWDAQLRRIVSIDNVNKVLVVNEALNFGVNGATGYIYTLATSDTWGYADCGKRNYVATEADELGDLPMPIDPKARKKGRASRGRAVFISDDNTAASIRMLETDGVRFWLRSGDETRTQTGWDETNPIAHDDDPFYSGGSDPSAWRVVMHHGYVFNGSPSTYGLPATGGYITVDDEIIRYRPFTFYKRGMSTQVTWTIVPAYYAPLAAATGPTSTIRNWRSSAGAQPGDDVGDIPYPTGLLVEIVSKNGNSTNDKQYYVASTHKETSPTVNSTSYITLDSAYENSVRGPDPTVANPDGAINTSRKNQSEGDLAVISGRGQWGTAKAAHDADTPVVFFPCNLSTGEQASVTLESYRFFSGLYVSLKDAIQRVARLAGMRSAAFRYAFSTPTATITQAITTTPYSLPAREDLSDFVLRMNAFLPVSGRLNVYFRSYYRLTLKHDGSGNVLVGLATTKTTAQGGVDADGSGDRWLGYLTVPVNAWISTTATKNVEMTLAVVGDDVVVELGGQPLMTFDLTLFEGGDDYNYNVQTAGPIQVEYSATQSGNSATFELLELFDEAGDIVIEESARGEGRNARAAIDDIIGSRLIHSRATQAGGVEFSQFWTRDSIGELKKNLLSHAWSKADKSRTSHMKVIGLDDVGESLDMTVIAADGYDYSGISTGIEGAPGACQVESRLQARENGEFAEEHELSGYGRLAAQPEDKCTLAYGPGGDIATQASTDMVLTGVRLDAQDASLKATYKLRLYKDVPA